MCVITVCVYLQTKTKDCSLCAYVVVVVVLFFIHCEIVIFHRPNIEDDPTRFCFSLKTEKKKKKSISYGCLCCCFSCFVSFLVFYLNRKMLVYHLHYNQMALDRRKEKKKSQKNIYCLHVCSPLSSVFRLLCREELNS